MLNNTEKKWNVSNTVSDKCPNGKMWRLWETCKETLNVSDKFTKLIVQRGGSMTDMILFWMIFWSDFTRFTNWHDILPKRLIFTLYHTRFDSIKSLNVKCCAATCHFPSSYTLKWHNAFIFHSVYPLYVNLSSDISRIDIIVWILCTQSGMAGAAPSFFFWLNSVLVNLFVSLTVLAVINWIENSNDNESIFNDFISPLTTNRCFVCSPISFSFPLLFLHVSSYSSIALLMCL